MSDTNESWLSKHSVGLLCLLATVVWLITQIIEWRKHGEDLVLTAINIAITLLLWSLLMIAARRYWRDARHARDLKAQIITIKENSAETIKALESERDTARGQSVFLQMGIHFTPVAPICCGLGLRRKGEYVWH